MNDLITALGAMMTPSTFSPEFRLVAAQLVVDQSYTHQEAAKTMGVGHSTRR